MMALWVAMNMNIRVQISIDEDTQRRAEAMAARQGISFDEYVKRAIDRQLGEPRRKVDISAVFDLGASSEPTDIARDKDKMIGEAVWEEHLRKTGQKQRQDTTE